MIGVPRVVLAVAAIAVILVALVVWQWPLLMDGFNLLFGTIQGVKS